MRVDWGVVAACGVLAVVVFALALALDRPEPGPSRMRGPFYVVDEPVAP